MLMRDLSEQNGIKSRMDINLFVLFVEHRELVLPHDEKHKLSVVMEKLIKTFLPDRHYHNDLRFIKYCIRYLKDSKNFCYLTLDPNTTHRTLILSEKNRVVRDSEREQKYSDHPERFDSCRQVLCKESVCGRCYWEVEWSGDVVYISVSSKDISRKGHGFECVFGFNNQSWSLWCSSSPLSFYHNNIKTDLRVPSPSRIGVYVDHSAGTLSFYSVSDTMKLLHRVHTTFTQPLYAGLWVDLRSEVRLCGPE
ncbi:hypothetical protein QTP70_018453 [Hemibagrus guttatus]|uniref:B30.2/SPRY domain-containing protein n=1 Tax=Hemibagrus guttatus TaxID=175788 RepID=A0AAE0PR92_9TELE|nr:hypothetical protein QTP70_018453 [Hemibagrus guttatus]